MLWAAVEILLPSLYARAVDDHSAICYTTGVETKTPLYINHLLRGFYYDDYRREEY